MIEVTSRITWPAKLTTEDFEICERCGFSVYSMRAGDRHDADRMFFLTVSGPGAARESLGLVTNVETEKAEGAEAATPTDRGR